MVYKKGGVYDVFKYRTWLNANDMVMSNNRSG